MAQWFALSDAPLRLTARGQWLHGDEPLPAKLAALFGRHVEPTGARSYQVRLGRETCPVQVDDAAYEVRRHEWVMLPCQPAALRLFLSDGEAELLRPDTLMQAEDHALYCRILRAGWAAPCRFAPAPYHALASSFVAAPQGSLTSTPLTQPHLGYAMQVGEAQYPIFPYQPEAIVSPVAGVAP